MEMILFTNKASKRKKDRQGRDGFTGTKPGVFDPLLPPPLCSNKHPTTSQSNSLQPNNSTTQQLNNSTPQQLNTSTPQRLYFDSDTQMLPAIITTTTSDSSSAFLFPVISLYSVIPQMLDTIVGPQQMIGNEIVSPVYAFA